MNEAHAKNLFRLRTKQTGNIDLLYGPHNAVYRREIVEAILGRKAKPSEFAWGNFRRAMLALYGITDVTCIADGDSQLRERSKPSKPADGTPGPRSVSSLFRL